MAAAGGAALAWPLKVSSDMEQLDIQFEVLLGSADAAKSMMGDLTTLAKQSPFNLTGVSDAAAQLIQARVAASDVLPDLTALGNAAMGDSDKFARLTYAFSQTSNIMKLTGDNARQMNEAGFSPLATIAEATGRDITELTEAMHNGEISMDLFRQSLRAVYGPGGRLGDLMERQSKTLRGLTSALVDAVSMGLKPIGDAAASVLKPLAQFAIGAASAFQAFSEKNQGLLRIVSMVLLGLVAVGGVIAGIGFAAIALSTIFGALATITSAIAGAIGFLFSPLGAVLVALTAVGVAAWYFRDRIITALQPVIAALQPFWNGIRKVWDVFTQVFSSIVGALSSGKLEQAAALAWLGMLAVTWTAISGIASAISMALDYLQSWIPGVAAIRQYMGDAFAGIGEAILAGRWDLAGGIMMAKLQIAWTSGLNWMLDAFTAITFGIESVWNKMADLLGDIFWGAVNTVAKGIVWIMEKIGMASEGTMAQLQQMQDADKQSRQQSRATRDADNQKRMAEQIMARQKQLQELEAHLADLESQAKAAHADAGGPDLEARAQAAREAFEKARDALLNGQPTMPDLSLGNQVSMGNQTAGKIASLGTFSGAAAGQALGINNRPNEETAANTREMRNLMKRPKPGQAAVFGS